MTALRRNICNLIIVYIQQEVDRRYMDPKNVLALIFANAFKMAKLKTHDSLYGTT